LTTAVFVVFGISIVHPSTVDIRQTDMLYKAELLKKVDANQSTCAAFWPYHHQILHQTLKTTITHKHAQISSSQLSITPR